MGCCLTCCDDSKSQNGDSDERTRLISDAVINPSDGPRIPSEAVVSPFQHSVSNKSDEQTMLNKILQQAAINVIDISTLGPHMMEQNEYLERRAAYTSMIDSIDGSFCHKTENSTLEDVPFPEEVLSQPPINSGDYIQIKVAAANLTNAISEMKVYHTEDLVVPFQIPQKRVILSTSNSNPHLPQKTESENQD